MANHSTIRTPLTLFFQCNLFCIMGFPSFRITPPKHIIPTLHKFLSPLVKDLLMLILPFKKSPYVSEEDLRPSPSLVLLPLHFIVGSIKERLPVVEFLAKMGVCKRDEVCGVCLRCMEGNDEVRELCNCCHVFHRECVDAWMDEGHVSCPFCRSKLWPPHEGDKFGADPWRRERMIYLFGEDYVMATSSS